MWVEFTPDDDPSRCMLISFKAYMPPTALHQTLCETIELVSISFALSSSIGILLQPIFLMAKYLARSAALPLNPVIFDDTMGITRTEDALIVSSPNPSANKQPVCKETKFRTCFQRDKRLNLSTSYNRESGFWAIFSPADYGPPQQNVTWNNPLFPLL